MAALVLSGPIPSAHAALFCSEPSKPYCIEWAQEFSSESEFEDCKWEMERYLKDARAYIDCLEEERDRAVRATNAAIETFNCLAEGNSYCP
ncbi:hypothetical protein [Afifella sp. H1R]|uniref:hypothetical protein n=1 Tax=Afifella sp. H1R TaxID=2908841 RepID=UPI001F229DD1|nr:hypothetical protein [Afifella sp. H1R]